jgi:hypothetical protein
MTRNPACECPSAPFALSLSHPARFDLWAVEVLCEELYWLDSKAVCRLKASSDAPGPITVSGWISCKSYPWRQADPVSILRDRIILRFGADHPLAQRTIAWSVNTIIEPTPDAKTLNATGIHVRAESRPESLEWSTVARRAMQIDEASPVKPLILTRNEAGGVRLTPDPEGRLYRGSLEAALLGPACAPHACTPICGLEKTSPQRVANAFVRFIAQTLTRLGLCERCSVTATAEPGSAAISALRIQQTGRKGAASHDMEREILSWDLRFAELFERLRMYSISLPYALEQFMPGWPPVFLNGIEARPLFCDSLFFETALLHMQGLEPDPCEGKPEADCSEEDLHRYALELVMDGASVTELVRGIPLGGDVTYETRGGDVFSCELAAGFDDTSDLIDEQNHASARFMQELPSIDIDSEKLEKIRSGKATDRILTAAERTQILGLVRDSVALSVAYGDARRIWQKPVRMSRDYAILCESLCTHEELLLEAARPAVRHLKDSPSAVFKAAAREYEEKLGAKLPQWLLMLPDDQIKAASDLCIRDKRPLPAVPITERARNLWCTWLNSGQPAREFVRCHLVEDIREIIRVTEPVSGSFNQAMHLMLQERDYRSRFEKVLPAWTRRFSGNVRSRLVRAALEAGCPLPETDPGRR